jgi:hypothetical protein
MKAEELDRRFDNGEDISKYLDLSKILNQQGTGTVRVLNLDDWSVTTVLQEVQSLTLTWARTQDVLAFDGPAPGGGRGIYTVQLPSGPRTFICGGQAPDWSPDDRDMVFAIPWNGIWKVDVASGITTRLIALNDVTWPVWKR